MDIFGIGEGIMAVWFAWNFWSIVPVALVFVVGLVIWKVAITPKEYQERLAWSQNRENAKLSQPRIRRIGTTVLIWMFGLMAATIFVVSIYKMLN